LAEYKQPENGSFSLILADILKILLENFNIERLKKNIKFQIFFVLLVLLFILKIIFNERESIFFFVFEEIVFLLAISSLILYLLELFQDKKLSPLSLVMNVGILSGLIFFLVSFSFSILNGLFNNILQTGSPGLVFDLVKFLYAIVFMGASAYIFVVFKELYYHRQKRSGMYFNTMVVFFILAAATAGLGRSRELDFIPTTFFVITILLITFNSLKISWIAFLTKKQKVSLLILSVLISVLFTVNLINNGNNNISNPIAAFSPALHQFINLIFIYGIIYFSILFFTTLFHLPTAEAYDRKAREVSSLQYFSSLINQVLDINDLEETITDLALKVSNADASWIAWHKGGELKTTAHRNIGFVDARDISDYLLNQKEASGISYTTLYNMENFTGYIDQNSKFTFVAVSGLRTGNIAQGFLFVASNGNISPDEEDISAVNTFAEYSSIAVENCRLLGENIEKERLEKELDVAREIQRKILPSENPKVPNIFISSVFIPAFEVGGDYYDFFRFNDNKMGFIIADVSGKGISAAFIMAEIKGIFESLSRVLSSPREILIKANEILAHTLNRKDFVSAAYGIIDTDKKKVIIARAGHCPVILLRDGKAEQLRPGGLGLGLNFTDYFSETLEETEFDLIENDTIVLYTDGITEAKNNEMEDFGNTTFEKILIENTENSVEEMSNNVIREVTLFSRSIPQHDDITLVIIKWKHTIKSDGVKEWQNSAQQLKSKAI
jgi:phosphoserine phosphatase RsbU/P